MIPFNYTKPDFDKKFYTDKWGKFIKPWKWHNEKGEWIFCTVCYEKTEIGKDILDKKKESKIRIFPKFIYENNEWIPDNSKNNILFDIKNIIETEKPIVIVDNEMSIDILDKTNKEDFVFTTWVGDISNIENTDFSILNDKKIYYFSSSYILSKNIIKFMKNKIDIIIVPPMIERPGWNIVDDLPGMMLDRDIVRTWILNKTIKIQDEKPEFVDEMQWPFKILGPGNGYMYFLSGENGQIFRVRQGGLQNNHMIYLAPVSFWLKFFWYETKKSGKIVDWLDAQDTLIREVNSMPPFDDNIIRGRGIWQDENKLIIHTGSELIINDNQKIDIKNYSPNGHLYERCKKLKLNIKKMEVSPFETMQIINTIEKLSINSQLEKIYLIGWCVLAIFSSILEWRPHIWITGSSGTGKSTILKMIIYMMLGAFKICPLSNSTAPGIFQFLKHDNFSILFDEAENNKFSYNNIKGILDVARAASSSSKEELLMKGTADQSGKIYKTNSMFCLSSVNTLLNQKSDKSRFSIINLHKNQKLEWKLLRKEIRNTFSIDRCEKVRSLFFYNWKTVEESIRNFKDAAGDICGDQRSGDQTGTLIAGYCLLNNFKIYGYEETQELCGKYLKNYKNEDDYLNDEIELLMKIFTAKIKYLGYDEKYEDTTLLNLLKLAAGEMEENTPNRKARKELFKYGINYNYENDKLFIAYKYEWIKAILHNTQWFDNYGEILKRLPFAEDKTEVCHFGNYYHGRAVVLEAKKVLRLSDDKIYMEAGI